MCGNGPLTGINRMREIRTEIATMGKNIRSCEGVHGWRSGTKLQIDISDAPIACTLHLITQQAISVFGVSRDVAPTHLNPDAAGKETPGYPTQISAELLNKYVRQEMIEEFTKDSQARPRTLLQ